MFTECNCAMEYSILFAVKWNGMPAIAETIIQSNLNSLGKIMLLVAVTAFLVPSSSY